MRERVETVVIGAGQAGFAAGRHLIRRGCEHVIPEQGEVADSWKTQRWDNTELDLGAAGISTVIWANGFRRVFEWIRLPVLDEGGWPIQQRGVTSEPGAYFLGLHWLHKRKSSLLLGVGEDAEFVADAIASR